MTIQHTLTGTIFELNHQQSTMKTLVNLFISSYKANYVNRADSDRGKLSRVVEGMYDMCTICYKMDDKQARAYIKSQFKQV